MCASQIFMEDPGSSCSHFSSEREGRWILRMLHFENSAAEFTCPVICDGSCLLSIFLNPLHIG